MKSKKVFAPEPTLRRLIYYMKCLKRFERDNIEYVLSSDLGKKCGVNDAVVRKDLSYFGEFGIRGKGYNTKKLLKSLEKVITYSGSLETILIGAGRLGTAILKHSCEDFYVDIVAAFDKDERVLSKRHVNSIPLYHIDELEKVIKERNIKVAILAIPPDDVQNIVDRVVKSGVKSILSLALVPISVPDDVDVSFFDVLSEVEYLYLKLSLKERL